MKIYLIFLLFIIVTHTLEVQRNFKPKTLSEKAQFMEVMKQFNRDYIGELFYSDLSLH